MPWKLLPGSRQIDPTSHDSATAWMLKTEREGEERDVRVDFSSSAAAATTLPAECRRTRQTRGRSAPEKFLHEEDPPKRIVIATTGIYRAEE